MVTSRMQSFMVCEDSLELVVHMAILHADMARLLALSPWGDDACHGDAAEVHSCSVQHGRHW